MRDSTTPRQLGGQLAVITGAAGGLGSAMTYALTRRGVTVVACDIDASGLHQLVATEPTRIVPWRMDVSDVADIQRSVDAITTTHGEIDLLIHTAVRHFAGDEHHEARAFTDHTVAQVLETLAVAVTGPTVLTQVVGQRMVRRQQGRIVFTGSMHRSGAAGLVMYTAAKAYLNTLARGLFLEWREHNIITAVANPGGMHTQLHGRRYPWMLDPAIVAEMIVQHLELPDGVALLSFDMVPHDPAHPDSF